jgi:hypothetical protein
MFMFNSFDKAQKSNGWQVENLGNLRQRKGKTATT